MTAGFHSPRQLFPRGGKQSVQTRVNVNDRIKYFRAEEKYNVTLNSGKDLTEIAPILLEPLAPRVPAAAPGYSSTVSSATSSAAHTVAAGQSTEHLNRSMHTCSN